MEAAVEGQDTQPAVASSQQLRTRRQQLQAASSCATSCTIQSEQGECTAEGRREREEGEEGGRVLTKQECGQELTVT